MPKKTKYEHVIGRYFTWRLYLRPSGVWYADGRANDPDPGRHSLGTKDRDEALEAVRQLDLVQAVELGKADPKELGDRHWTSGFRSRKASDCTGSTWPAAR